MNPIVPAINKAIGKLLKPLVRLLLRNGVTYIEFSELAKQTYVDIANEDFAVPGRKQSQTRVSVLTGIHRHEVAKLLKRDKSEVPHSDRHHRAARIISAWMTDPKFNDAGVARELTVDNEFADLVSEYGADVTTRSVLDELERVGAVTRVGKESVKLLVSAFTPQDSDEDLILILGDSVADLLSTLDHNLTAPKSAGRLHMNVVYSNLPNEVLKNLELVSRDRAMSFLTELNQFFATQDRDSNASLEGTGRNRAGIGLYYFEQSIEDKSKDKDL